MTKEPTDNTAIGGWLDYAGLADRLDEPHRADLTSLGSEKGDAVQIAGCSAGDMRHDIDYAVVCIGKKVVDVQADVPDCQRPGGHRV